MRGINRIMLCAVALLGATTDKLAAETVDLLSTLQPQAIIGPNSLEYAEAATGTELYDFMRVVARVETTSGSGFCTGTRVGHDLFMTNHHCMKTCSSIVFRMGYERNIPRAEQPGFKCVKLISNAEKYDYALYRVAVPATGADEYPIATLSRAAMDVGQPLLVPGHPQTRHKSFDRSAQCKVSRKAPFSSGGRINFGHTCDTEPGNSGSPVMNRENGQVVAIHWGAIGSSNASVPMHYVIDDITAKAPTVAAELTIAE